MAQKKSKYDRQLRIWGEHGQERLEDAKVCVLNCGPSGAEALKNLVLGGIGSFTIVDGARVEAADLGNNFLVDEASLHQSRAKCVSAMLTVFNEGVAAKFVEESPETLIDSNPVFFAGFSLVIATQMNETALLKLDAVCRAHSVPLLITRSYGLVGLVRISMKEHCVVESKPDNLLDDLRLHKPWPGLEQFVATVDWDIEDALLYKHIPWGVLLVKMGAQWMASHEGKLPSTAQERSEFKSLLSARKRYPDADNYREALTAAYKLWAPPEADSSLRAILEDKATNVDANSADFWVLVAALKDFRAEEGQGEFPLNGAVPDMHSTTDLYTGLQRVYQAKAEADVDAVEGHVRRILKRIDRDPLAIPRAQIKLFCRNVWNFKVLRYATLQQEHSARAGQALQKLLAMEDNSHVVLYILLRSVDQFAATYNKYPGTYDEEVEEDEGRLKAVAGGLLTELGVTGAALPDDLVAEVCRAGASELHCTGAIVGGVAAQEAIKLITGQFVPLSGTLVFNGMTSTSVVLQL